jgi:hypothetical protein
MNNLEIEVRQHLERYLAGAEDRDAFREWFVRATWPFDFPDGSEVAELVWAIEHMFAEVSTNELPEETLRELLAPLLEPAGRRAAS